MSSTIPPLNFQGHSAPAVRRAPARVSAGGFFTHHGIWAPGVRLFRNLRFASKAMVITLCFVVPLVGLLAWLLNAMNNEALRSRQDATRQHVEVAYGVLKWAHEQELAGTSRENAQAMARKAISVMRYDQNEYFWINDMHPRVVMHPTKPELDGKDVGDVKDPNGLRLFSAFVDVVRKEGKGLVAYQWPRPGADEPVDKISYIIGFEPWGWVVGSGIYVDDLKAVARAHAIQVICVVVGALLVAGYFFWCFYQVMEGGLNETRRHLKAMTRGDLTSSPSPWGRDEAAQLMLDLASMQDALRSMVVNVRQSSEAILRSSDEIAGGALDLSARTEQAAANLEQSAASMEQISATVTQSSEHTTEAAQFARMNAKTAAAGGQVMKEVVVTMEGIRDSSAKISEIISTIDSIAFQTNILALNAAVEAARSGEQGRGFAVVAGEVRMLARRSAEAAKEIKALIVQSASQVQTGGEIVRRAGETIEQIVLGSRSVDQLLGEVSNGAREQSLGIAQIGEAVQELDKATQQNAALVEQTAAAAAAMKQQAETLASEVARFVLPAGGRGDRG